MNECIEILRKIKIEEYVWVIYLIIIGLSFYSNSIEKNYYIKNNIDAKNRYRKLNIIIFTVVLIVYIYFFYDSYIAVKNLKPWDSDEKKFFNEANWIASTLILVAGSILLFIAIYDENLTTEIAFS